MNSQKITNSIILIISMIISGCASTPYEMKRYQKDLDKAHSGDIDAIYSVALANCEGLTALAYDHGQPYEKTVIHPSGKTCVPWWDKFAKAFPTNITKYNIDYPINPGRIAIAATEQAYFYKAYQGQLNQTARYIDNHYHPSLTYAQLMAYSDNAYIYKDHQTKRANLAKRLCDNDGVMCDLYASMKFQDQEISTAANYYHKAIQADAAVDPSNSYYLASLIIEHYDQVLASLQNQPLVRLRERYFNEMASLCAKKNESYRLSRKGLTHMDCVNYKNLKKRKKAILSQTKLEQAYIKDLTLPLNIRQDKYKLGVTTNLKKAQHKQALTYFDFLERTGYKLPAGMLYYKAKSLEATNKNTLARDAYQAYVEQAGSNGTYYRKALSKLNTLE